MTDKVTATVIASVTLMVLQDQEFRYLISVWGEYGVKSKKAQGSHTYLLVSRAAPR